MTHDEFVKKFNAGQIDILIDKNLAGYLYEQPYLLPRHIRTRQAVLRTVAYAGFAISLVLFFLTPWWVASGCLLASWSMFVVCQKSAVKGVYEAVLDYSNVYQTAIIAGVLKIKEK